MIIKVNGSIVKSVIYDLYSIDGFNILNNTTIKEYLRKNKYYYNMELKRHSLATIIKLNNINISPFDWNDVYSYLRNGHILFPLYRYIVFNNDKDRDLNIKLDKYSTNKEVHDFINDIENPNKLELLLKSYNDDNELSKLSIKDQIKRVIEFIKGYNILLFSNLPDRYSNSDLYQLKEKDDICYLPNFPNYKINILYYMSFGIDYYFKNAIKCINGRRYIHKDYKFNVSFPINVYPDLDKIYIIKLNRFSSSLDINDRELYEIKEIDLSNIDKGIDELIEYIEKLLDEFKVKLSKIIKYNYSHMKRDPLLKHRQFRCINNNINYSYIYTKNLVFTIPDFMKKEIDEDIKNGYMNVDDRIFNDQVEIPISMLDRIDIKVNDYRFKKVERTICVSNLLNKKLFVNKDTNLIQVNNVLYETNYPLEDDYLNKIKIKGNEDTRYPYSELTTLVSNSSCFSKNLKDINKRKGDIERRCNDILSKKVETISSLIKTNNQGLKSIREKLYSIVNDIVNFKKIDKLLYYAFNLKDGTRLSLKKYDDSENKDGLNYITYHYLTLQNPFNSYVDMISYSIVATVCRGPYFYNLIDKETQFNLYHMRSGYDEYGNKTNKYKLNLALPTIHGDNFSIGNLFNYLRFEGGSSFDKEMIIELKDYIKDKEEELDALYKNDKGYRDLVYSGVEEISRIIRSSEDIKILNSKHDELVREFMMLENPAYFLNTNIEVFKKVYPYSKEEIFDKSLKELLSELNFYFDLDYNIEYERTIK